ncbi:MAG: cadherin-like domain-containing protein, partial [Rhodospirillales bacterium]
LDVAAVAGDEDTAIALEIDAALTDTDGSESLSITIAGVPEGATLSAGTDNNDGTWTLTPGQLTGLSITPPADSNEDFTLSVTATSTESSTGDTASTTVELPVAVAGVADAPTVAANDVFGDEDTAIALDISAGLTDTDGSETLSVTVAGIPAGAMLSLGSDNGDGSWTISSAADLAALNTLTLTPPQNFAGDMNLSVTSTATEDDSGDTETTGPVVFTVSVSEQGDVIVGTPQNDVLIGGAGDDTINALSGNDTIHAGEGNNVVDAGAGNDTVTAGSGDDIIDGGSGNDTIHAGEGDNVVDAGDGHNTVTAGSGSDTVTGGSGNDTIHVGEGDNVVDAGNGHNTVTAGSGDDAVSAGSGNDTIHVGEGDNVVDAGDGHNTVTAGSGDDTVSAGSGNDTIYAGEGDNVINAGGGHDTVHTGSGDDVITGGAGNDTIYAGEGDNVVNTGTGNDTVYAGSGHDTAVFSGNFEDYTITIFQDGTVTTSGPDGNDTLRGIESLRFDDGEVNVNDIALPPVVSVETAQGTEDTAIAVNISVQVANSLASVETITIEGVPAGATLMSGTDNLAPEFDGSYLLSPAQLEGLTLTPPQDFNGALNLEVTASTSEGISSEAPAVLPVVVAAVDDVPDVTVAAADGDEDTAIELDIEAAVPGSTETVESVTIAGVPAGALLSAGTDNGDGSWMLTPDQLSGLTITPPEGDSTDFTLQVSATSTDGGTSDAVALSVTVEDTTDIEGTGQADTLVGTEADETMAGHEGDDIMVGGLGNDTIDGGAGDDILIGDNAVTGGNSMLHFIDSGNGNIVRMNTDGSLEIAVTRDEIEAATGRDDVDLSDRGLAIDGAGNIFFTDGKSDAVLMKPADGGAVSVIASENDMEDATGDNNADPKGITIGADGNLYVVDDESDSVLRIDPVTGAVDQVVSRRDLDDVPGVRDVDLGSGIVAGTDGSIYVTSDDDPKAVFEINPATGEASVLAQGHPFDDPDVFMTVAPNGDLIVADEDVDTIYRIPTSGEDKGEVSVFLSENDIQDVIGHDVELKGGIGFDADGNFYIADENTDGIYQWSGYDPDTGTVDPDSGVLYLSENTIETVQSHDTDLEGGIAFSAGGDWTAVNETAGGDDVLIGGAGNDQLHGGGGADHLMGGAGDDTLHYSQDAAWNSSFVAQNVGDPNSTGTGDQVGITGEARSYDVFDGGEGEDTIEMTDGDDALFLDDGYSDRPDGTGGPRIVDVENINAGAGNDVVDLTSNQYEYGDVTIDGGEGDDVLWSSSGDDTLKGGAGDDALFGGGGDDLIDGGAGFDTAFYAGNYSEYSIARGTDGSLTISGPEGSDTLTNVEVLDFKDGQVNVDAIGAAPTVQTQTASGREDNAINLGIGVAVANPFAAVTAVTVANIPAGSVVAAGTDEPFELTPQLDGSMSLTLTPDQLSGLNITPPQDFNGVFDLAVTATSSEGVTSAPVAYTVDVEAVNDAPTLSGDGQIDVTGGAATITNQDMQLSDVDNAADELFYQVTDGPDHGDLYLDGNLLGEGDLFTQDDIDTGLLQYVADGGEFEQSWAEGTPSWDDAASSVDQENLTMPQGGESVTLTFQSEGTGEKDIFGWYKIDADGNPGEAHVIWGNTQSNSLDEGETSYTIDGLQPGESFGLFIVPDGKDDHNWVNSTSSSRHLEINSDGELVQLDNHGREKNSTDDIVMATGNGTKSGIDGDGNLKIGFENGSTHHGDFDDLVVTVQYNGQSDGGAVAENDSFSFTAHDAEGQQVEDKTDGDGGYSVSDGQTSVNISIDPTGMS